MASKNSIGTSFVSFNGIRWKVRDALESELEGGNDFGFTDYRTHEIAIASQSLCADEITSTLAHEFTHACLYSHGFGTSGKMDYEQIAEFVSKCAPEIASAMAETTPR